MDVICRTNRTLTQPLWCKQIIVCLLRIHFFISLKVFLAFSGTLNAHINVGKSLNTLTCMSYMFKLIFSAMVMLIFFNTATSFYCINHSVGSSNLLKINVWYLLILCRTERNKNSLLSRLSWLNNENEV